jgi:branched-chain amino acid transport system substrate-binding protein
MCRRRRRGTGRFTGGLLATLIVASACSESNADRAGSLLSEGRSTIESGTSTAPASETTIELVDEDVPVSDGSVVSTYAGEEWFLGDVPALAVPADPTLAPIILGMINQEDPALGSYAEVRAAVEAAAAWVNAELGGVDGHPIEIRSCTVDFDPEQSRSCAREMVAEDVVALVGGVHVLSDAAAPILEQAGLVSIGGIPANLVEQRSRSAFFFSGGDAGALTGFMAHAAANGQTKVALAYAEEIESFQVAARDYGATVGDSLGLDVELIPFSFFATDQTPVIARAQEIGADALIVLAATVACVPVVRAAADLGLDAQLYLTGACAGTSVVEAAGDAMVGVVFNSEGAVDGADVEGALYQAVIDRYADEPAGGAGTVGFRGFMNLYGLLREVGADDATSLTLGERARSAVDRPSFWGHPYTCDGNQVPGLPALCAPQQLLFGLPAVGQPFAGVVTDWIPTDELLGDALR